MNLFPHNKQIRTKVTKYSRRTSWRGAVELAERNYAGRGIIQLLYTPIQPADFGKASDSLWLGAHRFRCAAVVHRSLKLPPAPSFECFGRPAMLTTLLVTEPPAITHHWGPSTPATVHCVGASTSSSRLGQGRSSLHHGPHPGPLSGNKWIGRCLTEAHQLAFVVY